LDREEAEIFAEQQESQYEEDEKKRESNQKLIKVALIGGSVLVGVLITGAIVMKVIRKKRSK
jgi:flagellar biosynthesis/type III secretory pathway M-ring protein FliF/YscJ